MSKEQHKKDLFENVLKILRLEAKKFGLLLELVEALAFKHLKEDTAPNDPTVEQREKLFDYIPWTFKSSKSQKLASHRREFDRRKFRQLKSSLVKMRELFEDAEVQQ